MTTRTRFPRTAAAAALKKLDADPFAELVRLARATENETIAMRIWLELLQYLAPRLRSIEVTEKAESVPSGAVITRAKQELFGFE